MILGIVTAFLITAGLVPPLPLDPPVLLEEPVVLVDGTLVVRAGGDIARLLEVGVLFADEVDLNGAVYIWPCKHFTFTVCAFVWA